MANSTIRYTFPKEERLHHKKLIQELFEKGSSFYLYPFKVAFLPAPEGIDTHQVLFSVSKRRFKHAVDRNLVKRRVREAYRLHKHRLNSDERPIPPLLVAYIYTGKEIHSYQLIESKLIKSLSRLIEKAVNPK